MYLCIFTLLSAVGIGLILFQKTAALGHLALGISIVINGLHFCHESKLDGAMVVASGLFIIVMTIIRANRHRRVRGL